MRASRINTGQCVGNAEQVAYAVEKPGVVIYSIFLHFSDIHCAPRESGILFFNGSYFWKIIKDKSIWLRDERKTLWGMQISTISRSRVSRCYFTDSFFLILSGLFVPRWTN